MQSVDEFIEQLLIDKGITDIEPDVKEELKSDMKQRLLNQINRAAIMELSEEKAAELATKVDDPNFSNEDMAKFMQESGVNLAEVSLNTMLEFRNLYLAPEA